MSLIESPMHYLETNNITVLHINHSKRGTKQSNLSDEKTQFYIDYDARYEPDTNMLYVKARAMPDADSPWGQALRLSSQYVGPKTLHFYRGTPLIHPAVYVHAFNLAIPHREIPPEYFTKAQRDSYVQYIKKVYKDQTDIDALLSAALLLWERDKIMGRSTRLTKATEPKPKPNPTPTSYVGGAQSRQNTPNTPAKPNLTRSTVLDVLTKYIESNKTNMWVTVTHYENQKPVRSDNGAELTKNGSTPIGRLDVQYNATNTSKTRRLYLDVGPLSRYLKTQAILANSETPNTANTQTTARINYKHDVRYTHNQSAKIHHQKGILTTYCAVFNLDTEKKPKQPETNQN